MQDLNSIQQSLSSSISDTTNAAISDMINQLLGWALVPSIIFMVLFLLAYVSRSLHRRKVDNAILEIRDMLKETNALRSTSAPTNAEPPVENN
jgi:hypothetical protein